MVTGWKFDFDSDVWLPVPADADKNWRRDAAERYLARGAVQPADRAQLDDLLDRIVRLAAARADDGLLFAFLPDPTREFLPLFVHAEEAVEESPDYLLDQLGARDPDSIDPPAVTHIEAKHLGEGVRVMRFGRNADDRIYGSLLYAWRCGTHDVVVFTQTYQLSMLLGAQDAIDAFLDGIAPVDE